MGTLTLLFISLLFLCLIEGSVDVTPVFVQTGGDVLLDGHKPDGLEDDFIFSWKLNQTNIIRFLHPNTTKPHQTYEGRVEFTAKNFSLRLKDLQKSDSGLYVGLIQESKDKITANYNITVVDPVSPVVLQVDSVSNTSVSCDVTVTCSTNDSDIISNFTCQNQTCSQEGGQGSKVTPSGASLRIDVSNGFIICNHSNQVSETNATKKIDQVCRQTPDPPPSSERLIILLIVGIVLLVLVLVLVPVLVWLVYRWRKNRSASRRIFHVFLTESTARTESPGHPEEASDQQMSTYNLTKSTARTESPGHPEEASDQQMSTYNLTESTARTESPGHPEEASDQHMSTYSLVGPHTGPTRISEAEGTNTLYAQVQKGNRPREGTTELLPPNGYN